MCFLAAVLLKVPAEVVYPYILQSQVCVTSLASIPFCFSFHRVKSEMPQVISGSGASFKEPFTGFLVCFTLKNRVKLVYSVP